MSRFTRADHRFAHAMNVDLGEPIPSTEDDLAERLITAFDSGRFDEEIGEPTIEDWQEHSAQVEREATQYHRNWKSAERHLEVVSRRNDRLIKILAISMGCTSFLIVRLISKWILR